MQLAEFLSLFFSSVAFYICLLARDFWIGFQGGETLHSEPSCQFPRTSQTAAAPVRMFQGSGLLSCSLADKLPGAGWEKLVLFLG